ncbi:FAD-dependent oxidoreductase [Pseudomonas putida]|uniref:PnpA1 n=1 Tax=Pseudomonas sp. (strain WBC-3) TaxID=165468 RepID=A0A0A0REQ1_PSEWB|nr:FAD-dependent oxidoreductase [Pseudomonas putida]AIV98011.1 PnpA1 [Pseudomonas sp. WBC-3]WRW01699.1 FAD-dependent oxidoreductase [Pseudomonas putida]
METVEGVVIVGAGSVGLLTALKLGRAGIRVVVLEARAGISSSLHAAAFTPTTMAALADEGLLEEVRKRAVMCPDVAYRHSDGTLIAKMDCDVLAPDTDYPYLLLLGQNHLCGLIAQQLGALPNVEIRWNHQVEEVVQDDACVTLQTRGPGGRTQLRSRWVVAADGANSSSRDQLGLKMTGRRWPERMVAVDVFYDFTLHEYSRANFIHDPLDWAFIVQLDQSGLWRVCYEENSSLSDVEIRHRMPERLQRLLPGAPTADQYRVEQLDLFQVSQRCVKDLRRGRVVLAGDAAHVSNPMGGLGLSGGVQDASLLGQALIAIINENAAPSVLDEYSLSRRKAFTAFTSKASTPWFTWMKEGGRIQRARDLALLEKAGTDRAVMREFLLDFEQFNGRRSRSLTSRVKLIGEVVKQSLHHALRSTSGFAMELWERACSRKDSRTPRSISHRE